MHRLFGYQTPLLLIFANVAAVPVRPDPPARRPEAPEQVVARFVENYCLDCHNGVVRTASLDLESLLERPIEQQPDVWETVARKLSVRQMPPKEPRPDESKYNAMLAALEAALDRAALDQPNPGRTDTFRRLNRTEYQNAIRDLLAIEIDASTLLPPDQASHGFDNITVSDLSATLIEKYVSAAQKISRLAIGTPRSAPSSDTIRVRADQTQEQHVEGLPIGTRGGVLIPYIFPLSGEYEIDVRLARDRNEEVEGLTGKHQLELLLDRARVGLFEITPPASSSDHTQIDKHLKKRITVTAGPHQLGVTFIPNGSSLVETLRQPYQARFNMHRHPRLAPAVFQVSITGPFVPADAASVSGVPSDTPSRSRIFICRPANSQQEEACARRILANLMRHAYRRPVTDEDLQTPMRLFSQARHEGGFEAGIEMATSAILVNPQFLFRIERDPPGAQTHAAYRISDVELASRLSFFLWSSIPDGELLDLAEHGALSRPEVLEQQVRRMLCDERSGALATNFAGQWLHLRNLDSFTPDLRLFPDFDDNLRQAFRKETELFFASVMRQDRSVLDLLQADYTFLNERLAKHYGISHVYGSRFQRVSLEPSSDRGGLLRHGSVLAVTSYATRTSPVIRGKWVLENIIGMPPPPPPSDVPALKDNTVAANLSVRERLAAHRANPACATCHNRIDPVGFALENFDAVGRWRQMDADKPVDATGSLPYGAEFTGVDGLEAALLQRPEWFCRTLSEKLLTFALGRGVEYYDAAAVRKIVRQAREDNYRFSSLVLGIANSMPFQMRRAD
jgi:hypothetical protein